MSSLLIPVGVALLFFVAFVLFNAALYASKEEHAHPAELMEVDSLTIAEHLGRIVRCQTVSVQELDSDRGDWSAFRGLQQELAGMYPRLHRTLTVEIVNHHSLLYTWTGTNPELNPILFAAHQDVVPIEPGTEQNWEYPPFAGTVADGFCWGRGTLDDKCAIIGVMEVIEALLKQGFHPERTVMLALGHDEEVMGMNGAQRLAQLLKDRGVELEAVLDEGGFLASGLIAGVDRPIAMVGIAEKQYMTIELRAEGCAGHSSSPQAPTAIGRLSRAIQRLETHPMPARLTYLSWLFDSLASELPVSMRLLMGNRWLLSGAIQKAVKSKPATDAMIRTTTAPTILHAGIKENVLPCEAKAVVNFRLLPSDSIQKVIEHVSRTINDEKVHIRVIALPSGVGENGEVNGSKPLAVISDVKGAVYPLLSESIRQVFPEVIVAPYLVIGATDARYYTTICNQVFRFSPIRIDPSDLERIHGTNERVPVKSCGDMVQFYHRIICNLAGKG
jgi:carboxypeptidase PM20D1